MNSFSQDKKDSVPNFDFILKQGSDQPPKKKLSGKLIFLIVLLLVLAIAVIVGLATQSAEENIKEQPVITATTNKEAAELFIQLGVKNDIEAILSLTSGDLASAPREISELGLEYLMTGLELESCVLQKEERLNDTAVVYAYYCHKRDTDHTLTLSITTVQGDNKATVSAYGVTDEAAN